MIESTVSDAPSTLYAAKGKLRREIDSLQSAFCVRSDRPVWLSLHEQQACSALCDASRREDWILGRWLMKRLIAEPLISDQGGDVSPVQQLKQMQRIEVLPQTRDGLAARPILIVDGNRDQRTISISHNEFGVAAAVSPNVHIGVGVDLVSRADQSDGFIRLWFTENERQWLSSNPRYAGRFWGAKEAAYKSSNQGERFSPRCWEVSRFGCDRWQCCDKQTGRVAAIQFDQVGSNGWSVLSITDRTHSQFNSVSSLL